MNKTVKIATVSALLFSLIVLVAACGGTAASSGMKKIADKKVNDNLTVTLSNAEGKLKNGKQKMMIAFNDGSGNPVDIKAASLNFKMPAMGAMAEMNNAAKLSTTSTPGLFMGLVNIEMAGEWIAQISYEGKETNKATIKVTAY